MVYLFLFEDSPLNSDPTGPTVVRRKGNYYPHSQCDNLTALNISITIKVPGMRYVHLLLLSLEILDR